jgi:RNA polymerase sigma-70 factor (ECF subfamily)
METTGVADAQTFTALYDRYAATILRYCARRVGPDAAEDVVAATFLAAYERWQAFDPSRADVLPWLYGIATNLLRRHRRSEVRAYRALARTGIDPLSNAAGVVESHELRAGERADASAQSRTVARVLARLPRRQRDVLLLYALADLGYAEIAAALRIPVGSVRSALHRARATLRAELEGNDD